MNEQCTVHMGGTTEYDIVKSLDIEWEKNVIGLYQQEVNILSQQGFAVAKQQEYRNQSHFCSLKGVMFAVSSLCAILYDPHHSYPQDLRAEKTKSYNKLSTSYISWYTLIHSYKQYDWGMRQGQICREELWSFRKKVQ